MNEQDLLATFPTIAWTRSLPVSTTKGSGLACRLCIALYGLQGKDVGHLPQTEEQHSQHIATFHHSITKEKNE